MIDSAPTALFTGRRGLFEPTELTRGGWSDDAQHGSPPSGLLARAVERVPTRVPMQVVRITIDLFREVPLAPLSVHTDVVRDGRRIQVVEATLHTDETPVGHALALKIRSGEVPLDPPDTDVLLPSPADLPRLDVRTAIHADDHRFRFHTDAVEIRSIDQSFFRRGEGRSWLRLLHPVVEGETPSPFVTAATLADVANGNSTVLDVERWVYVNPDITLYLHRPPTTEWVGMVSLAYEQPTGIGMTDTVLYDERGRIGRIAQAQVLAPR